MISTRNNALRASPTGNFNEYLMILEKYKSRREYS